MRIIPSIQKTLFATFAACCGFTQAATFVAWSTTSSGTADDITVTASYSGESSLRRVASNLAGPNFDPVGGVTQSSVEVPQDYGITWSFSQPVENLSLYLVFWRGSSSSAGGPPDGFYTFDQSPTIQSGLAGASVSGNSLVVTNQTSFFSGVLSFPGTITSLNLLPPATGKGTVQNYTMSFDAVPEPSVPLITLGGFAASMMIRRRGKQTA